MFSDDAEAMRRGIPTKYCRGALFVNRDEQMSFFMHPWRTLENVFGADDATRLGCWLLSQVHDRVVKDYLKIERYFLDAPDPEPDDIHAEVHEETLLYVAWAKASADGGHAEQGDTTSAPADGASNVRGGLPQLRRRHFFKLLERCGVSIEQGKGSEIKLLRKAKHPFRL